MNAPDNIKHHVRHEIHQIKKKLAQAESSIDTMKSGIDTLELLLTEIKWIQEQEKIDESK